MFDRIKDGMWWDRALTLVEGCTPVSPGCDNCWSAGLAQRFNKEFSSQDKDGKITRFYFTQNGKWTGKIICREDRLSLPLKVKKPTVWAVWNDLLHEDVPRKFIERALTNMLASPQHIFLILTKRPERLGEISRLGHWPYNNVWLGVTAENQEQADKRIPILLQIPAAVRLVSFEPLLSDIKIRGCWIGNPNGYDCQTCPGGETDCPGVFGGYGNVLAHKISWAIVGGESGSHARPMHPDWARSLRNQCQAAGMPFFFKQWGEWAIEGQSPFSSYSKRATLDTLALYRVGKKAAGRTLDGKEWLELPKHD